MDPPLCEPNAPAGFQDRLERVDPRWMGGEYLPGHEDGEVEIARLVLASTTQDVYSVRARWVGPELRYRIVDEYETDWYLTRDTSERTLSMHELIELIDRATFSDGEWEDLTDMLRDGTCADDGDAAHAADFVTVTSELYPELERYYAAKAAAWVERRSGSGACPPLQPGGQRLELPPDTPGWVRVRLERLAAEGALLSEEELKAFLLEPEEPPANLDALLTAELKRLASDPAQADKRVLPDIAAAVYGRAPRVTPQPRPGVAPADAESGPFDAGSFYRNRHRERIARAHQLADEAPPSAPPGLREMLLHEAERGRLLTHDDVRTLLAQRADDGDGEPDVRRRRR